MKKFILGFLIGTLIFSIIPVSAAVQEYVLQKSDCKLVINGEEYTNKELPMLNYKGYNYIPADSFKEICKEIGAGFEWVNEAKEIRIDKTKQTVEMEDKNVSEVIKTEYKGYEAVIKDDVTYVIYKIFRDSPNYMLFYDENENVIITYRKNDTEIKRTINKNEYIRYEQQNSIPAIYIPLNIVNELGL